MFDEFPRDEFYFCGQGGKTATFLGLYSKGKVYIDDMQLPPIDGFTAHRVLPNGREEIYHVESCEFQRGIDEIPDCFLVSLKKEKENNEKYKNSIIIKDSNGIQIGDNNIQSNINNITVGLEKAITAIKNSDAPEPEKAQLLAYFKSILSNQTFAAIIGGATSGLLSLIK